MKFTPQHWYGEFCFSKLRYFWKGDAGGFGNFFQFVNFVTEIVPFVILLGWEETEQWFAASI